MTANQKLESLRSVYFKPGWRILSVDSVEWACERLSKLGVEGRPIMAIRMVRPMRTARRKRIATEEPIFGYCWARFETPSIRDVVVDHIRERDGITAILSTDGHDFVVKNSDLDAVCGMIKSDVFDNGVLDYMGKQVRVEEGPFTGFAGKVGAQKGNGTDMIVTILLDLMGRQTPVDLSVEQVREVA